MFNILYILTLIVLFISSFYIADLWQITVLLISIGLIEKYIDKKTIDVTKI